MLHFFGSPPHLGYNPGYNLVLKLCYNLEKNPFQFFCKVFWPYPTSWGGVFQKYVFAYLNRGWSYCFIPIFPYFLTVLKSKIGNHKLLQIPTARLSSRCRCHWPAFMRKWRGRWGQWHRLGWMSCQLGHFSCRSWSCRNGFQARKL